MIKLTRNFDSNEVEASEIAEASGIDNSASPVVLVAATALACMVWQPLRDAIGQPIHFTSWYRCPELNSHPDVGGSPTSDHPTGGAADAYCARHEPADLAFIIAELGLPVDQVIIYPEKGIVHASHRREGGNRGQYKISRGGVLVPWAL